MLHRYNLDARPQAGRLGSLWLLGQHLLDRLHHRVRLRRTWPGRALDGLTEVLANAVILLPSLQGIFEIDRFPLWMAVFDQPIEFFRDRLGETPNILAVLPSEVEGHEYGFNRHRVQCARLPRVGTSRYLRPRVELGDALVGDWDQGEAVAGGDLLGEQLHGVSGHVEHGVDRSRLQR